MKTLIAFMKKEWMEQVRSGRLVILGIVFLAFGIMNPAVAKLTPWLMEMMSETLAESGMIVTEVEVDALDSWTQFYKNIPMGLIAFVLLQSSIFTKEYQSGTLVLALTKGLERYKVLVAKTVILTALWSLCYWVCFGVTYVYNDFYWDNSIAQNLTFAAVCWWIIGIWVVFLMVVFSVIGSNSSVVLLGTGGIVFASYMLSLVVKITEYLPTKLMGGMSLLTEAAQPQDYNKAIVVTLVFCMWCFGISIPIMNRRSV